MPEAKTLLTTVVVTVALSVVLHGLTSVPLVAAYHRWYAAHAAGQSGGGRGGAGDHASAAAPARRRRAPAAGRVEGGD